MNTHSTLTISFRMIIIEKAYLVNNLYFKQVFMIFKIIILHCILTAVSSHVARHPWLEE